MDFHTWQPYLVGGFALAIGWLFKQVIQNGKDVAIILYYMERQTKDAAIRLEQVNNPTPPEMQKLLKRYRRDEITIDERKELLDWLETVPENPNADPAERSAALQLLTGFQTKDKLLKIRKRWWQFI